MSVALKVVALSKTNLRNPSTEFVAITEEDGRRLKLSRYQRLKAISQLEKAGLAEVERRPKRAPRVRLTTWKEDESD